VGDCANSNEVQDFVSLGTTFAYAVPAVAGLLLLAAALNDVALRTIPNGASIALVLTGTALRLQDGGIVAGLLLAAAVFGVAVVCWQRGWMGGDVKLLAATALVVPPLQVGSLLMLTALSGGVLAVLYLILSRVVRVAPPGGRRRGPLARVLRAERWRICRGAPLPYGLAIAFGGITLLLTGP